MTANPRGRNQVQQTPHAAPPALLPNIPAVRTGDRPVDAAFAAIKQSLDVRNGVTGNPWERWITRRDLANAGLAGPQQPLPVAPDDALGLPLWTSREKFVMVTPNALALFIAETVVSKSEVQPKDLDELRRLIEAVPLALDEAAVEEIVARLSANPPPTWGGQTQEDIEALQETVGAHDTQLTSLSENVQLLGEQVSRTIGHVPFVQVDPAEVWTCTHNLGRHPIVTVYNDDGEKIEPDILHQDNIVTVITHGRATAGTAIFQ